jgi:hypothetical protein
MARLSSLLFLVASLAAAPIFVDDLPNLYQHQKSPPLITDASLPRPADFPSYTNNDAWWEPTGGWCCTTAVADLFYAMQKNSFDGMLGLFFDDPGKGWFDYMRYGLEEMATDFFDPATVGGAGAGRSLNFYEILDDRTVLTGAQKGTKFSSLIGYQEYYLDGTDIFASLAPTRFCATCGPDPKPGKKTAYTSMFDLYSSLIGTHAYIALEMIAEPAKISDKDLDDRGLWWRRSYHVVAGAGIDGTTIYIADPNETRTGSNPGAGWGKYYGPGDAEPVGQANYAAYTFSGNYFEQIKGGDVTYKDVKIVRALVLTPTPEPGTWTLVALGLAAVFFVTRSRSAGLSARPGRR